VLEVRESHAVVITASGSMESLSGHFLFSHRCSNFSNRYSLAEFCRFLNDKFDMTSGHWLGSSLKEDEGLQGCSFPMKVCMGETLNKGRSF
jgi:hypothetical protein